MGNCGCQCSSLTFRDKSGRVQGNCKTADHTGAQWCYVDTSVPSTCQDLSYTSVRFPGNPWSYEACATPACGYNNGGHNNGGFSNGGYGVGSSTCRGTKCFGSSGSSGLNNGAYGSSSSGSGTGFLSGILGGRSQVKDDDSVKFGRRK